MCRHPFAFQSPSYSTGRCSLGQLRALVGDVTFIEVDGLQELALP